MSKGIFITGIGTDVGKTYVSSLLIKKLKVEGYKAGYYKAVLSGATDISSGTKFGDVDTVKGACSLDDSPSSLASYVYNNPVSPHLASTLEGNPPTLDKILSDYQSICQKYEYITVEGSGGIVCPIRYDEKNKIFLKDIIKELSLACLIVSNSGLGAINSTVLTVEYMKNHNLPIRGIIMNNYSDNDIIKVDNKKMIPELTGIPVIATVKKNSGYIDISKEYLLCLYE